MVSLEHPLTRLIKVKHVRGSARSLSHFRRSRSCARGRDEQMSSRLTGLMLLLPLPPTLGFLPRGFMSWPVGRSGTRSGTAVTLGGKNDPAGAWGVGSGVCGVA